MFIPTVFICLMGIPSSFFLSAAEQQEGFEPLFDAFNAQDPGGWIIQGFEKTGPKILDNNILSVGGHDYWAVISKKEYENFVLRFDMKFDAVSNSGILLHTPPKDIYKTRNRLEIQLESGDDARMNKPEMKNGAIERFIPPLANPAKAIGEWNQVEIKYENMKLWVRINDEIVQDGVDLSKINELNNHPQKGHIAIQRNENKKTVYFKNIRIKKL